MKRFFLLALIIPLFFTANAKVEYTSFYFDEVSHTILDSSAGRLEIFLKKMKEFELQIIELNSFCTSNEDGTENTRIAGDYLEYIKSKIEFSAEHQPTFNNYGGNMIKLNFTPDSWNRVDVYYYIGREKEIKPDLVINEDFKSDTMTSSNNTIAANSIEQKEIIMNTPIVMPIGFVGGKNKIKDESMAYMENLFKTMTENPELYAHIRGHVCCNKRSLQSRRRAHVVYRYLVKKGIDKKRLSFKGYSNKVPIAYPEISDLDRNNNRRVDVIFTDYKGRRHYL